MKKILLLITVVTLQSLFALVTIIPVEIGEKPGISGRVSGGLETKRGNTESDNYKASLRVNYDEAEDYVVWAEISEEYGKANGEENTNKAFVHLRFIHTLTDDTDLNYELFAQLEDDKFRDIKNRSLAGAGLRYKLFNSEKRGQGFIGVGAFHEDIKYLDPVLNPSETNERLNVYFTYNVNFSKDAEFSYSLYYQPRLNKFSDHIQTNNAVLEFKIYEELFLRIAATWNVDTHPAVGVKKGDFTQRTLFVFKF